MKAVVVEHLRGYAQPTSHLIQGTFTYYAHCLA